MTFIEKALAIEVSIALEQEQLRGYDALSPYMQRLLDDARRDLGFAFNFVESKHHEQD